MMSLATLWSLDRTVDPATGASPVALSLAAHWDPVPEGVRLFRSSANSVYTFERDGRPAWLRIAAGPQRTRAGAVGRLHAALASAPEPLPWAENRLGSRAGGGRNRFGGGPAGGSPRG